MLYVAVRLLLLQTFEHRPVITSRGPRARTTGEGSGLGVWLPGLVDCPHSPVYIRSTEEDTAGQRGPRELSDDARYVATLRAFIAAAAASQVPAHKRLAAEAEAGLRDLIDAVPGPGKTMSEGRLDAVRATVVELIMGLVEVGVPKPETSRGRAARK